MTTSTPLPDDAWTWIDRNSAADPAALRLKYAGKDTGFDTAAAILQIECRRKYARKLAATLAAFPRFYFPNALAGEQASSDLLAEWHSSLIGEHDCVADLTAGLGIDALHLASRADSVTAIERNADVAAALACNADGLHAANITVVAADCRDFVGECEARGRRFDCIFIDPARRSADGGRVFALADCEPDVVGMLPSLARICRRLIIKMSPMLDISHTISELHPAPAAMIAAGSTTECKELVAIVDFEADGSSPTLIEAVTLRPDGSSTFAFTAAQEQDAPAPDCSSLPKAGDYICEPSPALMKAGASRLLCQRFNLKAFHPNTRIYHSSQQAPQSAFPGEWWRIVEILPYSSGCIKRFSRKYPRINVTARNFGLSADALRAKLRVADGGTMRLFAVSAGAAAERYLIVTEAAG